MSDQPHGCRSPYCEPPWCKNCGTQPFDRYHFWEPRPHPGELEYLRFVAFGYFVRPSVPWDGRGSLSQIRMRS